MNTAHKWNRFNNNSYVFYSGYTEQSKSRKYISEEPQNTIIRAEEYRTSFSDIPNELKTN